MKKKFIFLIAAFRFVSMMAVIDTKAFAADEI